MPGTYISPAETRLYYLNSRYYDPEVGRFISADGVVSGAGGSVQGYNLFSYCMNNPVNMSDESGCWPKLIQKTIKFVSTVVKVASAAITVSMLTNHVVNAVNKSKIKKEIKDSYTVEEAKEEIDGILKEYDDSSEIIFGNSGVHIENSMEVDSRYDRQKISMIISRTDDLTKREYDNISAEWLLHNIVYDMGIMESSTQHANLDYTKDRRPIVVFSSKLLEIFGWD